MELQDYIDGIRETIAKEQEIKKEVDYVLYDKYQVLTFLEELKFLRETLPCCPYDNKRCTKSGCYINGGECNRRTTPPPVTRYLIDTDVSNAIHEACDSISSVFDAQRDELKSATEQLLTVKQTFCSADYKTQLFMGMDIAKAVEDACNSLVSVFDTRIKELKDGSDELLKLKTTFCNINKKEADT